MSSKDSHHYHNHSGSTGSNLKPAASRKLRWYHAAIGVLVLGWIVGLAIWHFQPHPGNSHASTQDYLVTSTCAGTIQRFNVYAPVGVPFNYAIFTNYPSSSTIYTQGSDSISANNSNGYNTYSGGSESGATGSYWISVTFNSGSEGTQVINGPNCGGLSPASPDVTSGCVDGSDIVFYVTAADQPFNYSIFEDYPSATIYNGDQDLPGSTGPNGRAGFTIPLGAAPGQFWISVNIPTGGTGTYGQRVAAPSSCGSTPTPTITPVISDTVPPTVTPTKTPKSPTPTPSTPTPSPTHTPTPTPSTPTPTPTPVSCETGGGCGGGNGGSGPGTTTVITTPTTVVHTPTKTTSSGTASSGSSTATDTPPGTPTDFTAALADNNTGINLDWEPPTTGSPVASYELDRSTDGGTTWEALDTDITGTSYADLDTTFGTHYYYRLLAIDAAGNGSGYAYADLSSGTFKSNAGPDQSTTLTSSDHLTTAVIPAGALSEDAVCGLDLTKSLASPKVQGYELAAGPYTVTCKGTDGSLIEFYNEPIQVSIATSNAAFKKFGKLLYYVQNSSTNKWELATGLSENATTHVVKFSMADGFSYVVLGQPKGTSAWITWLIILFFLALIIWFIWWFLSKRRGGDNSTDDSGLYRKDWGVL